MCARGDDAADDSPKGSPNVEDAVWDATTMLRLVAGRGTKEKLMYAHTGQSSVMFGHSQRC